MMLFPKILASDIGLSEHTALIQMRSSSLLQGVYGGKGKVIHTSSPTHFE